MKKTFFFLIIFLCSVSVSVYARSTSLDGVKSQLNSLFSGLNKSHVSTGYLWDTAVNFVEGEYYNGSAITDSNLVTLPLLGDMLRSINSASVGADTICVEAALARIQRLSSSENILVGVLFREYNYIVENALTDNLIHYSNGVVSDTLKNGVWQNPYGTGVLFGYAMGNESVVNQSVAFAFADVDSLFVLPFANMQFDPGDGNGFRDISNGSCSVFYHDCGYKETILKITKGGHTYQSHSMVYVSGGNHSPNSGSVSLYDTLVVTAPFCGENYQAKIVYRKSVSFDKRPLIVSEGFDPWRMKKWSLHSYSGFTDIEDILYSSASSFFDNYDIFYVDWYDCGADIRANAEVFKEVIRWVNDNNLSGEPNIVLGQSMGGLIARYALRTMEIEKDIHNTTLYISHDVPYLGANISPGLLYTYWDLYKIIDLFPGVFELFSKTKNVVPELKRMGSYLSVKQMLPLYMNHLKVFNNTDYSTLQQELACFGFPVGDDGCSMENVAIVNGGKSVNGGLSLYDANDKLVHVYFNAASGILTEVFIFICSLDSGNLLWIPGRTTISFSHDVYPYFNNSSLVAETDLTFKKNFLWTLPVTFNIIHNNYYAPSSGVSYDNYTCSEYKTENIQIDSILYHSPSGLQSTWIGDLDIEFAFKDVIAFVPTASAMSMPTGYSRDFFNLPPTAGVDIPFDSYILQDTSSVHIDFFPGISGWLGEIVSTSVEIDPVLLESDTLRVLGGSGTKTYSFSSSNPSVATVDSSTGVVCLNGNGLTTLKASWAGFGQAISKSRDVIIGYPSVTLSSRMLSGGQCMVRANAGSDTERRLIKAAVDSSIIRYKWGVKINHNPVSWRTASSQDTIHVNKPSTGSVTVYMKWERSNGESGGVVSHSLMRGGLFSCNIGDIYEDRGHVITYTECLPGFPEVTQEYGHQCFVFSESTNHDPSGEIVSITIGDNTFDLTGTMIANSGELLYVFDILYDSDFLDELYYTHTNGLFGYRLIDIYINDSSGPFQEVNIFYRKELNTGPILDDCL